MIQQIDHINLVVRDLATMERFYTAALGLRNTRQVIIHGPWIDAVVGLTGVRAEVIYLDAPLGQTRLELIHYLEPAAPPAHDSVAQPNLPGLRHLAFKVEDIEVVAEQVMAAGGRLLGPVQCVPDSQVTYEGGVRKKLVYFLDPEGNLLELCRYA